MTEFIADIASYQSGLKMTQLQQQGFAAVIIKCSQGAGYINPYFANWVKECKAIGFPVASYHYLSLGNWDVQAANILKADPDSTVPVWLDREAQSTLQDAVEVANRLRSHGQHLAGFYGSRPPQGYGAYWMPAYYNDPSGAALAVYSRQGGDTGHGWSNSPDMWQYCQKGMINGYSNSSLDFSAYRGTRTQLLSQGWFWTSQEDDMGFYAEPEGQLPGDGVFYVDGTGVAGVSHVRWNLLRKYDGAAAKTITRIEYNDMIAQLPKSIPPLDVNAIVKGVIAGLPTGVPGTLTIADIETALRNVLHNA
jgi:hypothetical protein